MQNARSDGYSKRLLSFRIPKDFNYHQHKSFQQSTIKDKLKASDNLVSTAQMKGRTAMLGPVAKKPPPLCSYC